jgi:signal transduction histidine kinase
MAKNKEDLIKERDDINAQISALNPNSVSFSVDANIINRLGRELIGKAETGVSELIKNAYDADATLVKLNFIDSNITGGQLVIEDNGHGMSREDLIKGFMTLSSTTKIHEPLSPKHQRQRAGRKGIGRFATQFLGERLVITTQTKSSDKALRLTIDWNSYVMDKEISSIENAIEELDGQPYCGTTIYIEKLRHSWTVAQIKRVFRYISDLLQPSFLSENSAEHNIAWQGDSSFLVECYRTENGLMTVIADINKIVFEKALAEIEGYVTENSEGFVKVNSESFNIHDSDLQVSSGKRSNGEIKKFNVLKNVHFKTYYFIYDRPEYYKNGISKLELNNIEDLADTRSGLKVYRNGFRVLPYGEIGDDWVSLDRRRTRIEVELEDENVAFNIPYTNKNFFGFVEIIDREGEYFEETASREGLIENEAMAELKDFVRKAIITGIRRLSPFVYNEKQKRDKKRNETKSLKTKVQGIQAKIEEFASQVTTTTTTIQNQGQKAEIDTMFNDLQKEITNILDELAMLRILATLGITIGEFTHEIIQFPIFFNSKLKSLLLDELDSRKRESLEQVIDKINHLDTYTSYFNDAVSRNAKRQLEFIELRRVIRPFIESTKWDFEHEGIIVETEFNGFDLYTIQMHPSEWHSILLNLYTNAKKALRRAKPSHKKIKVVAGKSGKYVFVEFSDNGDGVKKEYEEKIFDAFFTTATPAPLGANSRDQIVGSGLGLKILKDIVTEYQGDIFLTPPSEGYNTCFRIEIPMATEEQILKLEQ